MRNSCGFMIWILELSFGSNVVAYLAHKLDLHLECPYLKKIDRFNLPQFTSMQEVYLHGS